MIKPIVIKIKSINRYTFFHKKKIVKKIKDSGLKVQASINEDLVRVTGKKIDDLQEVIQASKGWDLGIPLQYENMRG